MKKANVRIVYYSRKMLQTLDLNAATRVLMDEFGDRVSVAFEPMTNSERITAEDNSAQITVVTCRFMVKLGADGASVRREDLEEKIVAAGRK